MPTILPDVYVTEECRDRAMARIHLLSAGAMPTSEAYEAILIAGLNVLDAADAAQAAHEADTADAARAALNALDAAKAGGQS